MCFIGIMSCYRSLLIKKEDFQHRLNRSTLVWETCWKQINLVFKSSRFRPTLPISLAGRYVPNQSSHTIFVIPNLSSFIFHFFGSSILWMWTFGIMLVITPNLENMKLACSLFISLWTKKVIIIKSYERIVTDLVGIA